MVKNTMVGDMEPTSFDKSAVTSGVTALLKYAKGKKADALFMDAPARFLLDITAFKTPSGKHHYYNIVLPNSPYPDPKESLDILLVVRDVKGKEPEHVIGQVQDELRSSAAKDQVKVRQIMTLKQLQDDYSTYEAKRALSKTVDVVIAEHKVFKMMPRLLGREFQKKKKHHIGIPGREFKEHDLGEQIMFALKKTVLNISLKGQTSTVVVGHDNLNMEELTGNVSKLVHWLNKQFPGGWGNIQKLALHTGDSGMPPLVIYFSLASGEDVKKLPTTKGGSVPEPTSGSISTLPGSRVRVHATGEVEVSDDEELSAEDKALADTLVFKPKSGDSKRKQDGKNASGRSKRTKFEVEDEVKEEVKEESDSGEEDEDEEQDEQVSDEDGVENVEDEEESGVDEEDENDNDSDSE